jgi:molecular chaperone HscB
MIDFSRNHFELLGVPVRFRLDEDAVDRAYRALQSDVHPDRHSGTDDAGQRLAMQASARVNEAYRALKNPVLRAQHLLALHGIDAADERDTNLSLDFLERREAVADAAAARNEDALSDMLTAVRREIREREDELETLLDHAADFVQARDKVRELRFLTKLAADIDAALAEAEA